jgi:hypothetical protein
VILTHRLVEEEAKFRKRKREEAREDRDILRAGRTIIIMNQRKILKKNTTTALIHSVSLV